MAIENCAILLALTNCIMGKAPLSWRAAAGRLFRKWRND